MKIIAALLFAILWLSTGCAMVSMHKLRPVEVSVQNKNSELPVPHAKIKVSYWYDSYGYFYVFNKPENVLTNTDSMGFATIQLADFRYGIHMQVNETHYELSAKDVLSGGRLSGSVLLGGIKEEENTIMLNPQRLLETD